MVTAPLVPPVWQLPDAFRNRLGSGAGRQRLMVHEGQLLLVAHDVPLADEDSRRGLLFWLDGNGQWHGNSDPTETLGISRLIDRYHARLDEMDHQEAVADRADDYLPLLDGLSPIVRSSRNLLGVLEETRQALPNDRVILDQRDRAYEISRRAELLYQDARNAMEVAVVRRAEEQTRSSQQMTVAAHRLNTLAAAFFPFATLSAIFGTTLTDNWPWSQSVMPFAAFLGTGIVFGILMTLHIRRPA